jgi:ribosomal protein L7/L12
VPETEGVIRDVIRLLEYDQKIAAIKRYRERYRSGLLESKQAVDALADVLRKFFP